MTAGGPEIPGWAELEPSGTGLTIGGIAVFKFSSGNEAVVPLNSNAKNRFFLPFDNSSGYVMGVALANPSNTASNLQVEFKNENGVTLANDQIQIPAKGHTSFVLAARYPALAGVRGVMTGFTGLGATAALGIRLNPQGAFTSVPSQEFPD
jgi:hypothetical protein